MHSEQQQGAEGAPTAWEAWVLWVELLRETNQEKSPAPMGESFRLHLA